jgi:hypothetical protein
VSRRLDFNVRRKGHNLDQTRGQFKMIKSLEHHNAALNQIMSSL